MDLYRLLTASFDLARGGGDERADAAKRDLHADRSVRWVEGLAAGFRAHFAAEPDVCVFSKYHEAWDRSSG